MKGIQHYDDVSVKGEQPPFLNAGYDTSMWNPIHYAIYYQRLDILKLLLNQFTANILIGMRLPPINEHSEYIIPYNQIPNSSARKSKDQPAPRRNRPLQSRSESSPENVLDEMPSTNFAEY